MPQQQPHHSDSTGQHVAEAEQNADDLARTVQDLEHEVSGLYHDLDFERSRTEGPNGALEDAQDRIAVLCTAIADHRRGLIDLETLCALADGKVLA